MAHAHEEKALNVATEAAPSVGTSSRTSISGFSWRLRAQKTPCTRAFREGERDFLCFGDSGAERIWTIETLQFAVVADLGAYL